MSDKKILMSIEFFVKAMFNKRLTKAQKLMLKNNKKVNP
jgi:hypothetical protein